MAFSKKEQEEAKKYAQSHGYRGSTADPNRMINGKGGKINFSETGGSATVKGSYYSDLKDYKGSKKW